MNQLKPSPLAVKGTVVQQSYTSHNGGAPTGEVSVTAYSSRPEDLEPLLKGEPRSRLHGLAAITTTKKFGGTTGATLEESIGVSGHRFLFLSATHCCHLLVRNNGT